jgi:uncharacterized protein
MDLFTPNTIGRTMSQPEIVDNTALHRFELREESAVAFLLYTRTGNAIRLIHTEVPKALKGKGMGSRLVEGVLRLAELKKLSVIPVCPFVAEYLRRHPEYSGTVDSEHRWMIQSDR